MTKLRFTNPSFPLNLYTSRGSIQGVSNTLNEPLPENETAESLYKKFFVAPKDQKAK